MFIHAFNFGSSFIFRVMCLGCDFKFSRPELQELIKSFNPDWSAQSDDMAPDADVQLTDEQIEGFRVK